MAAAGTNGAHGTNGADGATGAAGAQGLSWSRLARKAQQVPLVPQARWVSKARWCRGLRRYPRSDGYRGFDVLGSQRQWSWLIRRKILMAILLLIHLIVPAHRAQRVPMD